MTSLQNTLVLHWRNLDFTIDKKLFTMYLTGDDCARLTGQSTSGTANMDCYMDWCRWPTVVPGGLYVAPIGGCGEATVLAAISVHAHNCYSFTGVTTEWAWCDAHLCEATGTTNQLLAPFPKCPGGSKDYVYYGIYEASAKDCLAFGGGTNYPNAQPDELHACHFEFCHLRD